MVMLNILTNDQKVGIFGLGVSLSLLCYLVMFTVESCKFLSYIFITKSAHTSLCL